MTDGEIIALAKQQGWNTEHFQTNRMLIEFARALAAEKEPLTDDEIVQIRINTPLDLSAFVRAVEKAHGIGEQHER